MMMMKNQTIYYAHNLVAKINWEQFPMGVIFLSLSLVAFVWLVSLRGVFKNQILLQRQLFMFLCLHFLSRGVQQAILHQFCFRDLDNRPSYCYYMDRVSMTLDLLSSALNFTIYSILVSFWAEKYYGMRRENGGFHSMFFLLRNHSSDFSLEKIRRRINVLFWLFQVLAYGIVLVLIVLVWSIPNGKFSFSTAAYQYSRMSARVLLSTGVCLGLLVYGGRVYMHFRNSFSTQRNLSKVAYITLYCGSCYFVLVVSNVVTTPLFEVYGMFRYSWIFFNVFSLIEISANLVLLLVLTPRLILNAIGRLFCRKPSQNSESAFINANVNPMYYDPKYLDVDYDYKPTPFSQTYLDNYEYSDEYSDSEEDSGTQSIFEDTKYYSG